MYRHILIPLENTPYDRTILDHVKPLARLAGGRLHLLHVADGWAARNYDTLALQESEEMREDRDYLSKLEAELAAEGFEVSSTLAAGEPAREIVRVAQEAGADLIAMSTHGHGLINDILRGSTADKVRHAVAVPVLMLRGSQA